MTTHGGSDPQVDEQADAESGGWRRSEAPLARPPAGARGGPGRARDHNRTANVGVTPVPDEERRVGSAPLSTRGARRRSGSAASPCAAGELKTVAPSNGDSA
jgi:hypothetical protein